MIAVALASLSAFLYGLADFLGGMLSKRASAWAISVVGLVGAILVTSVLAVFDTAGATRRDYVWATVGGVGGAFAIAFLYRGLAAGRMGVVAPISALGGAVITVSAGLLTGERPSLLVWLGIFLALPAIWLVSREGGRSEDLSVVHNAGLTLGAGVVDGAIASVGVGVMLVGLGHLRASAGLWPAAWLQVVSLVTVIGLATMLREPWVPRTRRAWSALVIGLLIGLSGVLFVQATRHGYLSIAGVVVSLYPAATVLLAVLVLGERVYWAQVAGLALGALAISCVALG